MEKCKTGFAEVVLLILVWCSSLLTAHAQPLTYFFEQSDRFFQTFVENGLVNYSALRDQPDQLNRLWHTCQNSSPDHASPLQQKAFWINAYNIAIIKKIVDHYPIASPQDVKRFFTEADILFGESRMSLNELEREKLLKPFDDARLHFVLVCGAKGCPPLISGAYLPDLLEEQLNERSRAVLNNSYFVDLGEDNKRIWLSELFEWYSDDFGQDLIGFINQYRASPLPDGLTIRFRKYDWALNTTSPTTDLTTVLQNENRYRASFLLPLGQSEIKLFNSLYTQSQFDGFENLNSRSSYFAAFGQYLYGFRQNLNIGADVVFRSTITNDLHQHSPFRTLRFQNRSRYPTFACADNPTSPFCDGKPEMYSDTLRNSDGVPMRSEAIYGLSHMGPKVKFAPVRKWTNISLQQTVYIPIQKAVDGQWVSFTQLFFDYMPGQRTQLFVEASAWSILYPDFKIYPFVKVFYSYFPDHRWTFYAMTSIPIEYGLGTKFLITENIELEALYTYYLPVSALIGHVRPQTFNLGFRLTL